jgi:hypothetical protein
MAGLLLTHPLIRCDEFNGGAYRITGTVDELGVAGAYRVRLYNRTSGQLLRETWSAANGAYTFLYLANRPNDYFAVAFDHGANPWNAAIADLITPERMP